jgi:hypothetical protein
VSETARIARPVADLLAAPDGPRDRQVLYGHRVEVLARQAGWARLRAAHDGYEGWTPQEALGEAIEPTHRVAVPATHLYPRPDIKARERCWLSFNSELRVVSAAGDFFETPEGFVPKPHLRPLNAPFADFVTAAQLHFGVPYLWGGNSTAGIDCSGLVQGALRAAGRDCPGDSGPQEAALGTDLPEGAAPQRGDLYFWPSHMAIAVDGETLIHANAHHMAVAYEPIAAALARIAAAGGGPLTRRARPG